MSDPSSPWAAEGASAPRVTPLLGTHEARLAIVGGGFTGLALACRLASEIGGEQIRLVERDLLGAGASTRNSGMIGPGVCAPYHRLVGRLGRERAREIFGATVTAVHDAVAFIAGEGFDADLVRGRQYKVAASEPAARALQAEARALRADGFDVDWLDRTALGDLAGSSRYLAALVYPDTATVQPWRLLVAMREHLQRLGVHIHEHSAARSVRASGGEVTLTGERWRLTADRVVLATNAALPELGVMRHRVFPLAGHLLRTKPLSPAGLARLGIDRHAAVIENRRIFNYFRLDAERRLVFGGGRPWLPERGTTRPPIPTPRNREFLARELRRLFPDVPELAPEHHWAGVMGFTIDNWPLVTDSDESRIVAAGAWCGHGLALSLGGSRALAARLLGQDEPRLTTTPWSRRSAPRIPPGPWLRPSLSAYIASLHALDVRDSLRRSLGAPRRAAPLAPGSARPHRSNFR